MTPPTPIPMDIKPLIQPLPKGGGVGVSMRYTSLFDEIQEAMREDDPRLSRGVWEMDLKKAEWDVVESLCVDVLTNQSKDIQVAIWLCKAWMVKYGMEGLHQGLMLLNALHTAFWDTMHPVIENGDLEQRVLLFEWFDREIAKGCLSLSLARSITDGGGRHLTLADWMDAVDLDRVTKRAHEGKKILTAALDSGKVDLTRYRQTLTTTALPMLEQILSHANNILLQITHLKHFLEEKISNDAPTLSVLQNAIETIQQLAQMGIHNTQLKPSPRDPHLESSPQTLLGQSSPTPSPSHEENNEENNKVISERSHAYQALRDISRFLLALEPHSPVPGFLSMLGSWETLSLAEIFADIKSRPPELQALLRLLADATKEEIKK